MQALVILHKNRRRTRRVRPRHARSTHIRVITVNRRPDDRGLVRGCGGCQRGDPGARRHEVRFDAAVFAGTAARKISHRVGAVVVKPVGLREGSRDILGSAGGDHIFARGRTVHRLRGRSGIARRKFQDVRLIAGS